MNSTADTSEAKDNQKTKEVTIDLVRLHKVKNGWKWVGPRGMDGSGWVLEKWMEVGGS